MDFISHLPKQIQKKVDSNVPLAKFTSFRIGGPAKYFTCLDQSKDILAVVSAAKKLNFSYKIIGGGSNLLVSEKGFDGVIIKVNGGEIEIEKQTITVDAGVSLAKTVQFAHKNSLTGLEFAIGIPGTVGGAIWGNAGAFRHLIGEIVDFVEVLDQNFKVNRFNQDQCQFDYRESIFKNQRKEDILLKVVLNLEQGKQTEIKAKMTDYFARRPKYKFPSAGSIFVNPLLPYSKAEFVKHDLDPAKVTANGKVPAGYLIDHLDLKGTKIGGAVISEKHGNIILNASHATAEDVVMLIGIIKQKVRDNFGIQLQEEVQYIGF